MNKAILMGYVGRDPDIRYIDTRPVASFPLATTERAQKLPNGADLPERTEWHNIVMYDTAAEIAEKYIRKGTKLLIEGKLRTRVWEDRNTIKRYVTEIYVDSFDIVK